MKLQHWFDYCKNKGIINVIKTEYDDDGNPGKSTLMPNRCTYNGRHWKVGGKVVSHNWAKGAVAAGYATASDEAMVGFHQRSMKNGGR